MKKLSRIKNSAIALLLAAITAAAPAQAIPVAAAETQAVEASAAETPEVGASTAVKNGWVKQSVGYCYYKNGKKLTNKWLTIGSKKYYLGSNGARKTGWYTIKNKSYYFSSSGVLKKSKSIDKNLVSAMDKIIKSQKITDSTSKKTALKKLFTYCQNKFGYARAIGFTGEKNWEYSYAKQMLSTKKGSCYHYAAAYAFLAKRATGYPVRICWGTSNAFNTNLWQNHAWVEIKIGSTWYTYDANAAKYSSLRKGKWYQQKRTSMEGKIYKRQKYVNVEL